MNKSYFIRVWNLIAGWFSVIYMWRQSIVGEIKICWGNDVANTFGRATLWTVIQKLCLLSKLVVCRLHKYKYQDQRLTSSVHVVITYQHQQRSPMDSPQKLYFLSKFCDNKELWSVITKLGKKFLQSEAAFIIKKWDNFYYEE